MTAEQTAAMYQRIEQHGKRLLLAFPGASVKDPIKLCKRLRALEAQAYGVGLRLCNGPEYREGEQERIEDAIRAKVAKLIGSEEFFINKDPRGYALKVSDDVMRQRGYAFHRDWGGYGILAPDLSENE